MPILPFFTLINVIYCYLIWNKSSLLDHLSSDWAIYAGLALVAGSCLLYFFRTIRNTIKLDCFSVGCIFIWYASWVRIFGNEAPAFFAYPILFTFITVVTTHFVVNQYSRFDRIQTQLMEIICGWKILKIPSLAGLVLVSLYFTSHYMIYPIAMTVLIVRYSFQVTLGKIKNPTTTIGG